MTFPEFVAIKRNAAPSSSIDYKAMSSFCGATSRHEGSQMEDLLRIWIAAMIDKGLSPASRKRYVEKISSIYYKDFGAADGEQAANPFDAVRQLRDCRADDAADHLPALSESLTRLFPTLMQDAKTHPELGVFIYLLLNASADIEKAVALRTDCYTPQLAQLDEIISPEEFHHRRRYVFPLNQSRKRMPQLVREVFSFITSYLTGKGLRFTRPFTPPTIVALWIAKARESGVSLPDLRALFDSFPEEYSYLELVKGSRLTERGKLYIRKSVAEAFYPTAHRWYAMKLRRGATFADASGLIKERLPEAHADTVFFYPMRDTARRVGKKIVKESVPFIPDVVFLRSRQNHVADIDRTVRHEGVGWMFRQTNSPSSDYSVIDRTSMQIFQKAVGDVTPDMKMELTREAPVGIGREVRVVGGMLAGYTGRIYDIKDAPEGESRQIFIRLSESYGIRVEVKIDEYLVEPLPS